MKRKNKNIGGSVVALTISKMLTLVLSVALSMVLSRSLCLDDYGTYSELQTITSLAMSVFALGLPNSLNYFLPTCTQEEKKNYIGCYYLTITLLGVLIGIVMLFARNFLAEYYKNPALLAHLLFLTIIPWTKLAASSRSNMLVVEGKIKREFIYCIGNALCLLIIALFAVMQKGNLMFFTNAYVTVEVVYAVLVYAEAVACGGKIRFSIDKTFLKEVLVFSIPLGISTAISTISLDLDKLIIGRFMDESAVAIYANAGKELPFTYISASFTAVILPEIVKYIKDGKTEAAVALWKNATEISFLVLAFCACACIVFAPQIICILYSEKYLSGVGIFRIYSLVLLLRMTYWGMILNAYGKSKQILYNSIICLVINLILSVSLYYVIGFAGPAAATFISILVMAIVQLIHSSLLTGEKMSNIFPWKSLFEMTLISTAFMVVGYAAIKILSIGTDSESIYKAVLIGVVWGILYFLLFFGRIKKLWINLKGGEHIK